MAEVSKAHVAALEHWKSVHDRLVGVISEYVDASSELEKALRAYGSQGTRQERLPELDPLLFGLSDHEDTLRETRLRLNVAHDPTHAMTPINMLHPELLITIFTLATQESITKDYQEIDDDPVSATTLASVCTSWRWLITRSPLFWTDLDIVLTGPSSDSYYERAALWAQRAQSAPLWLNIVDIILEEEDYDNQPCAVSLPEPVVSRAMEFLSPLMPFVRTLSIGIESFSAISIVPTLLGCWIQHGSPDVAQRLRLCIDFGLPELEVRLVSPDAQGSDPSEFSPFFKSIKAVHLENVIINWAQPPYSGLTDLHLEFTVESESLPTQEDLSRLLAASPGLRSLVIHNYSLRSDGPTPDPVALDHLETLGLETMSPADTALILPLISSTSDALRVALSMDDDETFVSAVRSFLSRTNVTLLYVDGSLPATDPSISALFTPMPHLHTLTIQTCNVSSETLQDFSEWCISQNDGKNPWPALHTLNLLECGTTTEVVDQVIRAHGLRTLGIHMPRDGFNMTNWSGEWSNAYVRAATKERLAEKGVNLIWYSPSGSDLPTWTFAMT